MNKVCLLVISVIISLSGCSSSNDTATSTQTNNNTQNNALSGYKNSLDTAKSITSMAEANEKKKQQAIQDSQ